MTQSDFYGALASTWAFVSGGAAAVLASLPPAALAIWIQAVGSVLAILCALWIMRRQGRAALLLARQAADARERSEQARSRAFAAFLIPHVQHIQDLSDRYLKRGPDGQAAFKETPPSLLLLPEMPQGVDFIDNVALLPDELRFPVIDLFARIALHNADLDAYARTWPESVNRRYFETVLEPRWRLIQEAQGAVLDALARILQAQEVPKPVRSS